MMRLLLVLGVVMGVACTQAEAPPRGPNPMSVAEGGRPKVGKLRGEVREVLSAGSYTYLRLKPEEGALRWVGVLKVDVEVGATVDILTLATRSPFHSARLERDFDALTFGIVP